MRSFILPAWARLVLVLVSAALLSTWIDPYLDFGSSITAQAVNAVIPVILVLLLWGFTGRAWLALLVEAALLGVLAYADSTKVMYLNTDLLYADFTVIGGLLKDPQLILGFVHPTPMLIAGLAVALLLVIAVLWLVRRRPGASWMFRAGCLVAAMLAGAVVWNYRVPDVVKTLGWEVFTQTTGGQRIGVAGNIMLGRMTARDIKRNPDVKAEQAFWKEPAVREAEQHVMKEGNGQRPDIVIIQSESMFEPSQLCGFSDKPVLQRVANEKPSLAGNLHVPVFGGRTLQTEFETLTGAPIAFYPGSMFAYYELMDHHIDALPHVLDGLDYKTIFIHPNTRGFWRRDAAMPDMGFGTFQDIGSFIYPRDFSERGHVTDATLTRAILAELDSANRPTFVTAVSMDNHGPWGAFAPKDDSTLGLPAKLTGDGRAQLADYVAHAIDADKAYGFLLDALKRRGRPTIVLIYGDHLPALPAVYSQLCFKDGKRPEQHLPPYRIWANFPTPVPPDVSSAYLLQGWLMHAAGLPLHGHVLANALAGLVAHDPAISEPDRQRVLAEYANIAAANIGNITAPNKTAATVFVDREHALDMLMKLESGRTAGSDISVSYNDLYLSPRKNKPAQITFDTHSAVDSLTLRPYMASPMMDCLADADAAQADVTVEGDGHVLYRASLTPKTVRLATLDLRGINRLTIRTSEARTSGVCDSINLRVAQILCYSAQCDTPGPGSVAAPQPSRILSNDPIHGDIAVLGDMMPQRLRHMDTKRANLLWMVSHEKAKQQGLSPFMIDQDAQLFMHPNEDHSAWIDFDITGVNELELTPQINPLDAKCEAMNDPGKEAGLVGLTVSIDGTPVVPRLMVDRSYHRKLPLKANGGRVLRIEVDKGNGVSWCDWFSVGVDKLEGPALAPNAANTPASHTDIMP